MRQVCENWIRFSVAATAEDERIFFSSKPSQLRLQVPFFKRNYVSPHNFSQKEKSGSAQVCNTRKNWVNVKNEP